MRSTAAIDWLNSKLAVTDGQAVTYTCAATGSAQSNVIAVPGHSTIQTPNTHGAIILVASNDWIIQAADLATLNSGNAYTPTKGDKVTTPTGAVYELMDPPYTPSDHTGRRVRLHSVRVA